MARLTGIDKSSVSRLLGQLQAMGFVVTEGRRDGFATGPGLFRLGATLTARDSLNRAARPILESLAARFDETCYLAVRDGNQFMFRMKVETTRPIRFVVDLGFLAPLHAGAAGRAILMGMPDEERQTVIAGMTLLPLTESTITDPARLLAAAEADQARRYSISYGERARGATAVAAPFFDGSGICLGSVVVVRPDERTYDPEPTVIGAAVAEAARELSVRLGWVPGIPEQPPPPGGNGRRPGRDGADLG